MLFIELMKSSCDWWSSFANFASWEAAKGFANSVFVTSLIGALAGAFAGAVAAQRTADRSKQREELLREIRNTNAAIAVAYVICNALLGLKKQHVKDLKERFDTQNAARLEFMLKRKNGKIPSNAEFVFEADLMSIQVPATLPTDTLRALVFDRLSLVGRPLTLVMTVTHTVQSLNDSLAKRNNLIESYKSKFSDDNQGFIPLYFGLPYGDGHINLEYPGTIEAISSQTDDGIFFSNLLCKDLQEHGKYLSDAFKKKFKKGSSHVTEVNFATDAASGLMPDEKKYADWVKAFEKA